MYDHLKSVLLLVTIDGKPCGVATYVGAGRAVTCAHIVKGRDQRVGLHDPISRVDLGVLEVDLFDNDVAVIQLRTVPTDVKSPPLSTDLKHGDPLIGWTLRSEAGSNRIEPLFLIAGGDSASTKSTSDVRWRTAESLSLRSLIGDGITDAVAEADGDNEGQSA